MEFAPQQNIDKEISMLIKLEKMIIDACKEEKQSNPTEEAWVPRYLIYPYATKAILIVKREFLNKYKNDYTYLCNNYLKETSARVNNLIASYVQLTRTMSFDRYVRSASEDTKNRDRAEQEKFYKESKEVLAASDEQFKKSFRDPYISLVHDLENLLKLYEAVRDISNPEGADFSYSRFLDLKNERTFLRKTIDEHLVNMLAITKVEAKFNSEVA